MGAVRMSHHVRRNVFYRYRLHTGGVSRRDVPGQRSVPVLGVRVRHSRLLLVLVQQNVPRRLTRVRLLHHVLDVLRRQLCLCVFLTQVRNRDNQQNVP